MEIINLYTAEFKNIPSIDKTLANRYGQQLPDIQEWLSLTCWSQEQIDKQDIDQVCKTLKELKRIEKILLFEDIVI